jgi:hypothetical protein
VAGRCRSPRHGAPEFCAPARDPGAPRCHPLPEDFGRIPGPGDPAPGEDPPGCRHKLSSVASKVWSQSLRVIIEAMIDRERDPAALAQMAKSRLQAKIPQLEEAFSGRFDSHQALGCRQVIEHVDFLVRSIATLTADVTEPLRPFESAVTILCSIPGVSRTAHSILDVSWHLLTNGAFYDDPWSPILRSDTIQRLRRSGSSAGTKTSASRPTSPQPLHSDIPDVTRRRRRQALRPSAPHRAKEQDAFHPSPFHSLAAL